MYTHLCACPSRSLRSPWLSKRPPRLEVRGRGDVAIALECRGDVICERVGDGPALVVVIRVGLALLVDTGWSAVSASADDGLHGCALGVCPDARR